MDKLDSSFIEEGIQNIKKGQLNSLMPIEYLFTKYLQRFFGFFILPTLVLSHFHIGEYEISLRRTIATMIAGGLMLAIVAPFTNEAEILWLFYFVVFVVAIAQRFYTKREKRKGRLQFSKSFGYPFLMFLGLQKNLAHRLTMLISGAIALLVMQIFPVLGWWLFIGAVSFSILLALSMSALEEQNYAAQDVQLKAVYLQQQEGIKKAREQAKRETQRMQEEQKPQQEETPHQVQDVKSKPKRKTKPRPKKDYGDLLDS